MTISRRQVLQAAGHLAPLTLLPSLRAEAQSARARAAPPAAPAAPGPVSVFDFEALAKAKMNPVSWEYYASGNADDITLRWNREAFEATGLRPHQLVDVSGLTTGVEVLGQRLDYPILLAPTALHRVIHPDGELATAAGAGQKNTLMVLSSVSTTSVEDVARAARSSLWFQLYLDSDRGFCGEQVQRAQAVGCRALCVTVDSPVWGPRNRTERAGFDVPPTLTTPHYRSDSRFLGGGKPVTWADIDWLRSIARVPILLKGILHPAEAAEAARRGIDGLVVSNHGGRNLDTSIATLHALPDVVKAVAGRALVLMDGGVRRGTDVLKALALGASAVLIGRPYLFGLCVSGAGGVAAVLDILQREFAMAMALCGQSDARRISPDILWSRC